MKKIISVMLVALMLCAVLASCAKPKETITAKVKVTVEADDTKILEKAEIEIEGIDGEAPLAIDAIIAALDDNDIPYDLTELGGFDMLEKIGDYDTEDNAYIWELYLNGDDDPAKGRLSMVEIEDGDTIVLRRNAYESVITTGAETDTEKK